MPSVALYLGDGMPVIDTFTKRQARMRGESADVFTYDDISSPLRVQMSQIIVDMFGEDQFNREGSYSATYREWSYLTLSMRREIGVDLLPPRSEYASDNHIEELRDFLRSGATTAQFLDAVEIFCTRVVRQIAGAANPKWKAHAQSVIDEVNIRFREHALGYQFDGELIRLDSELVHAEVVKPALALLRDPLYKAAEEEFLKAYEHFRTGDTKDAITNSLKAFESTIKIIATKRRWQGFDPTMQAKGLVGLCYDNNLIPPYWQGHFSGLRQVLESGIPTPRNKLSGHGAGATLQIVPDELAAYVLHMTASTIVFLVSAEKSLP